MYNFVILVESQCVMLPVIMMNTIPYQTQEQVVEINEHYHLTIKMLLDQQQYYDPEYKAKRLGICSASWPLFGMLWPSSIQLARKLLKRPIAKGQKILEIGCGLGIASLTAQHLGYDITASDRHPLARKFLAANAKLNNLIKPEFKHAQWGNVSKPNVNDTNAPLLSGRYDHILASDVLYEPDHAIQVANFIQKYADQACDVWLVDPNRGYHNHFTRAMADYGFQLVDHFRLPDLSPTAQYKGRLLIYQRI